ncbi:MAG: glycosyltransferase family 4 protein [Tannerellaceae bacterium]
MKKIIFSDNTLWGLLNFRKEIIDFFVRNGWDVILVAPDKSIDNIIEIPETVRYIPINMNRTSRNPFNDLVYFFSLFKIYLYEKPDCIFHYTIKPNIYGSIVSKLLNIRSFSIIPGLGVVFNDNKLHNIVAQQLYKFSMKYTEKVLVLNIDNYDILLNNGIVRKDKLMLLPGGEGVNLDVFKYSSMPQNIKPVFLMISRMLYEKGFNEFVTVAKELRDLAIFRIMGPIDDHPSAVTRDVIDQYVLDGCIEYVEFSSDVMTQIIEADCVVLPSFYGEGLSRVLMEGLAIGRPIVTTRIAGCKECVNEGVNGYTCLPRSSDSLKDAILNIINLSPEQRAQFGFNSYCYAMKRFDVKKVVNIYDRLTRSN